MKHLTLFSMLILCGIPSLQAQDTPEGRPRIYRTWITTNNRPGVMTGALLEIKDSSIIVSNSIVRSNLMSGDYSVLQFNYRDIGLVQTRNINSIRNGAIIGGAILGIGIGGVALGEMKEMPGVGLLATVTSAAAGAGIGALVGALKDRIPINGILGNLNSNRVRLQKYSYIRESDKEGEIMVAQNEHKSYIGLLMGPSFPVGDLRDGSSSNENAGQAVTGYCANLVNVGYRITPRIGASVFLFDNQYDTAEETNGEWWGVSGILAGPMFTFPIATRLLVDLKPRIGFAGTQLLDEEDLLDDGSGVALNLSASLQYNFARRWSAMTEAGYFSSSPKYKSGGGTKIQAVNLGFGIAYRFL